MFELASPSRSQWAVQVLTRDYLIEGNLDGERDKYSFRLVGHDVGTVILTSARFQPATTLAVPARPPVPQVLIHGDELVALIPRDEAGTTEDMKNNAPFKYPVPAEVYVGPYVIRGQVLSMDKNLRVFATYVGFVVQDAVVDCLLPGAQLTGLKAPYLLVMSRHKQLVVPLGS